jgi:hypothetical protein
VQKTPLRAEGLDDAAAVGVVRQVAARAAGHEDFDAWPGVLFHQQHALAALGGADRRQQTGRAGARHDHVPGRAARLRQLLWTWL